MDKLGIARVTKLAGRRARFLTDCSSAGGKLRRYRRKNKVDGQSFSGKLRGRERHVAGFVQRGDIRTENWWKRQQSVGMERGD